jgi:hypothetical protein
VLLLVHHLSHVVYIVVSESRYRHCWVCESLWEMHEIATALRRIRRDLGLRLTIRRTRTGSCGCWASISYRGGVARGLVIGEVPHYEV